MTIGDYQLQHYLGLPTLEEARERFQEISGDSIVSNIFRPFFVEHGMDKRFGAVILHQHFDLNAGEKLVEQWHLRPLGLRDNQRYESTTRFYMVEVPRWKLPPHRIA